MYSERKLRYDRSIIYKFYLCVLLVVSALLFSDKVMAETLAEHATNEVQKNVFKELPETMIYPIAVRHCRDGLIVQGQHCMGTIAQLIL